MHMEKIRKTQIAELLLVSALLVIIAPLLSTSSLRSANLYFVVNVISIAVAAEAGLFSFFLVSAGNEKPAALSVVSQQPVIISACVFPHCKDKMDGANKPHQYAMVTQVVEKCYSDKILGAADDQVHKALSASFSLEVLAKAIPLKQDMLKIMTKKKKLVR